MILSQLLAFGLLNSSLPSLVNLYEEKYRLEDRIKAFPNEPSNLNLPIKETFDFIVVGGGAAGCIVSRRLADHNYTVLVLEAGGDPPPLESVPSLAQSLKWIPSIHYIYTSVPQQNASLSKGGIIPAAAGKMMGGSSSHNSGQCERGSPHDFDNWSLLTREDSWRYEHVLKYFLKSENYDGRWTSEDGQHAHGGPINVITPTVTFRDDLWFSAGEELGYTVNDPNGPQKIGFSPADYTWKDGRRDGPFYAFIKPVEATHETLTVRRYSTVSEIIFDDNKKAVGVLYERHGVPSVAFASHEIVISAGAYRSPILLINSGIGPAKQVQAANKPLLVDLPVGENMEDHVLTQMPPIFVEDQSIFKPGLSRIEFEDFDKFLETGEGPLNFDSMHEVFLASSRSAIVDGTPDWPDLQLYLRHNPDPLMRHTLLCDVNVNRAKSRGTITFNEEATTDEERLMPVIDYKFYSDPSDMDVMLEGMEFCRKIVEDTTTFKDIGARYRPDVIEGCENLLKNPAADGTVRPGVPIEEEREYWTCFVRQLSSTNFHVSGTNRMGHSEDPTAIVDPKFRVFGVTGLRVADASIFPHVTDANIVCAVQMIAEKAAEDIINTWL